MTANDDDRILMSRIHLLDRDAFDALMTRHEPGLFRFARVFTHDVDVAEDVVQETFLALWRTARAGTSIEHVRGFLYATLRHAVSRRFRRRTGEPLVHDDLSVLGANAGWGQVTSSKSPDDVAMDHECHEKIIEALTALPPESQAVIVLRDIEELDGEVTAKTLGITLAAMKSRLHRARLLLMHQLQEDCHGQ